jgi:hypothetical protein
MSEESVAQHYSHGALEEQILDALVTIGVDPAHLQPDQLAPVDEFSEALRERRLDPATVAARALAQVALQPAGRDN